MKYKNGKKCGCGIVWTELPEHTKEWIDEELKLVGKSHVMGYFFNCVCGSTLFISQGNPNLERSI